MLGRKDTAAVPSVVAEVERRTAEAAALAAIAGQERLSDPRTNPAVRSLADELRDDQQRRALKAEDARLRRRLRVADARAAEAERALEALTLAREASSPARSVLALHQGRRRYMRISMAASVVLAAGSAMGVEAAAHQVGAPTGSGYIAEVGLTGLATLAIHYRAHLAEHRGTVQKKTWQNRVLWALMTLPLAVSVGCNLATLNAVGAFCAIGAAAFAVLAFTVADRSAAAMQDRAAEVTATDEDELRSVAMGADLFAAVDTDAQADTEGDTEGEINGGTDADTDAVSASRRPDERERPRARTREDVPQDHDQDDGAAEGVESPATAVAADPVAAEADRGVGELEAWLADQDGPDGGVTSAAPVPGGHGPQGAAAGQDAAAEATMRPGVHIDGDLDGRDGPQDGVEVGPDRGGPERVLPAIEARRAVGASTRQRIAEYLAEHPDATVAQIAADLGLSRTTVKRHRQELRRMQQAAARRATHGGER